MNARYTARKKRHMGRDVVTGLLILSVTLGLFSVMTTTIMACYANQNADLDTSTTINLVPASEPAAAKIAVSDTLKDGIRDTMLDVTEPIVSKEGEPVTRLPGIYVDFYSDDIDYPEEMKKMLKLAMEEPDGSIRIDVYLANAELMECESNRKVQETGEGEITHIFSKWNTDLQEMDRLLYETYPFYPYTEHDVIRLASIIHMEAGSSFVSDAHQRDVASVPINRVLDGGFGGSTIDEVIDAPNQYPGTRDNRKYNEREWNNALYVLQHGPTTTGTYQANFVVSTATEVVTIYDYRDIAPTSRVTYICR